MAKQVIEVYLSGGAANSDIHASLGGAVSSVEKGSNTIGYESTSIPGVALVDATGFKEDGVIGSLDYQTGGQLSYTKQGGAAPASYDIVDINSDGGHLVHCTEGDAYVSVDVTTASFGGDVLGAQLTQTINSPNLFQDVGEAEALSGSSKYRHLYLKNADIVQRTVNVHILSNYNGLDFLEIGFFTTVSGVIDELLPNEDIAPTSVVFNSPTNTSESIELTVQAGDYIGMYLKRTVTALTDLPQSPSSASIIISSVEV